MRLWFKILREDYKASSRITTSELRREDFSLARELFSRKQLATVLESKERPRELVNPQKKKNTQSTKPVLSDAEETSIISKSKNNHGRRSSWM